MAQGVISTLSDRGFGFIAPDDGTPKVFFHQRGLTGVAFEALRHGDRVSYTAEVPSHAPELRATNVSLRAKG